MPIIAGEKLLASSSVSYLEDSGVQAMLRLQRGDRQAFEEIYEAYRGPIMNYVRNLVQDMDIADEIVQDVFFRAYRARETYTPQSKLSTWLWQIARNACLDELRKSSRSQEIPGGERVPDGVSWEETLEAPIADAEAQLLEHADQTRLERALSVLPAPQREALLLRTTSELSYDEIAQVLGTSVSAVKSLLFRARETLTKELSREEER